MTLRHGIHNKDHTRSNRLRQSLEHIQLIKYNSYTINLLLNLRLQTIKCELDKKWLLLKRGQRLEREFGLFFGIGESF